MALRVWLRGSDKGLVVSNAGSLVGTTLVTSALGFVYWWVAARSLSPAAVGYGAATVSAMALLGGIGVFGLGTLMVGELPRRPGSEGQLIGTALAVASIGGGILGLLFAAVARYVSPDLRALSDGFGNAGLFAIGVSLAAATLIFDQAMIGLLQGGWQLSRNVVFSAAKLVVLLSSAVFPITRSGMLIYAAWALGNAVSLIGTTVVMVLKRNILSRKSRWPVSTSRTPAWVTLKQISRMALAHHAANLCLQVSSLGMPVLVTAVLSASITAYFYAAWTMFGFIAVGPNALAAVLYAVGTRPGSAVASKMRFTIGVSACMGVVANIAIFAVGSMVLGWFGRAYAEHAGPILPILALSVFPIIVKDHFVTVRRIQNRIGSASAVLAAGSLLELLFAATGARISGLFGLSIGFLLALCLEAIYMSGTVRRAIRETEDATSATSAATTCP